MVKTAVCLSGTLCDEQLWASQVDLLSSCYELVFPSISTHNNVQDLARHILTTLPQKFVLLGMSAGVVVGLEILRQAPQRVEKFCMIAGNPNPLTAELAEKLKGLRTKIATQGIEQVYSEILLPISLDNNNQTPAMIAKIIKMAQRVGVDKYTKQVDMLLTRTSGLDVLQKIDIPVLVVCGQSDKICPAELSREVVAVAKNATLVELPNTGHYINWENELGLNQALHNFLG